MGTSPDFESPVDLDAARQAAHSLSLTGGPRDRMAASWIEVLVAEVERLRGVQSSLKPFDGSTGLSNTRAGKKEPLPPGAGEST